MSVKTVEVAVGMGSNIAPEHYVPAALAALRSRFAALEVSTAYACPAVGFSGNDFVNLVVLFETAESIDAVQAALREIETELGRDERARDGSRTMDLDLLLYGATVHDDGDIRVPRADILTYAFVLGPLAELRPNGIHPTKTRRYRDLWAAFDDADQPLRAVQLDG
ncbi:2-amino-4-hydroxy-6-hydroxymethyldihydropteridine diphosphokinase [Salinisphaera sp. Q1T1-3]|uniref:2-amino-4-hydroxy-6- hydroxymethyldihydropteridine diphosphokinase n=1 Tax=Salinisphaera sp. Q1T1-3 TaxID=2321229 RepID=UPI000E758563|nr:2-amino-4-hydroxy-6-hydroxymethyldihydropteridine diphosphokinase [Salinisphaera sp. Q1T1-3]RJS91266.1 2-amino-4-hydroxy-6-hydroxymethyldihydropteridine diphosphokinase [Salinisphaera sp. Q1T1-3]